MNSELPARFRFSAFMLIFAWLIVPASLANSAKIAPAVKNAKKTTELARAAGLRKASEPTKAGGLAKAADLAKEAQKYRLPLLAKPSYYELSFEPDLEKFTFTGEELIKVELLKPGRSIYLNALELEINSAQIRGADGKIHDLAVFLNADTQKLELRNKKELSAGAYELNIKFKGKLNDQLRGFYRVAYQDDAGKKHYLASTQMEPTDARRMFPCFDEPQYKAVFKIKALIDRNHVAISNAPLEKEEMQGEKKLVTFEPGPKMSSYLLTLVVGDFKCTGETKGGGVPIKVWAVNGKEHLGKEALAESGKILDYLCSYFGLPYIGKKLDLIAIPEFSAGAMENIGAITYRDSALLMDDKTGSSFEKQGIFGITAHEMAHQWFGDLVTMAWWDDLWLNEAFATWMATKAEEAIHPEWRSMEESIYSRLGSMSTDSLKASRAIHADVINPAQAIEMFDGITYSKGASVLRMLESFVGEKNFQKGVSKYLKNHSYGNAEAADFWNAIAKESANVPVPEIMRSFVYQAGYPQLNLKFEPDGRKITLSQYRQLRLGQDKKDPSLWLLPLVIRELPEGALKAGSERVENSKTLSRLFDKRSQTLSLDFPAKQALFNAGGRGYYRTCYQSQQLKNLQESFNKLSSTEKLVLINDCSSFVLPGDVAIEDLYKFVYKINGESDPLVLAELVGFVAGPYSSVRDNAALKKTYERWARHILLPLKEKMGGWNQKEGESQQEKSLRLEILSMLGCSAQDQKTIEEARAFFASYIKERSSVNPDQIGTVIGIVAYNGGQKEYEELLKLYRTAKNPNDSEMALWALPEFHQKELAEKTVAFAMGKEVKLQDGLGLICGTAYNYYTRDFGWDFIKKHWPELLKHFPETRLRSLGGLCGAFDTAEKEAEFRAWYEAHPIPFAKSQIARSLESMHTRVLFKQRYKDRICKWLVAEAAKVPAIQ